MLKLIYLFLRHFLFTSINKYKKLCYWFFPNIIGISKKRIVYKKNLFVDQTTLCNGKGKVEIGENCSFGYKKGGFNRGGSIELQARYKDSIIKISDNVSTNNNIMLCAANYIEIGEKTLIGQYVTIMDHEAHNIEPSKRQEIGEIGKVLIGKNTWIGNNVVILKNSHIGDNTIIATGAVVSGKFPANVVIGGVPAKIIRSL